MIQVNACMKSAHHSAGKPSFLLFVFALLLLPAAALDAQTAGETRDIPSAVASPLSVEDAIRIALEQNHRIRIARINAEIAENNIGYGTAGFLPTLDANGSASLTESDQESNSPFSFGSSTTSGASAQLALNWTLFDGFRMFAERQRYVELARLGQSMSRAAIEQTVVSVVRGYLQAVQQQQLLGVLEEALAISRVRFEKAQVRRDLGGSTTEFLNAQIAFQNDSSAVLAQQLAVEITHRELNFALGRSAGVPVNVETELRMPKLAYDLETLLMMARERNADLRTAEQTLRTAERSVSISRGAFYPRLSLFANYGYSDRIVASSSSRFTEDIRTKSTDGSLGLNLSLNLFNGFRNALDSENAALQERIAELAFEEAGLRIEGLVREEYLTVETRLRTVELEQLNLDAASKNLALQLERYETGTVSSLEFRDAQLLAVRAQTALIVARFQARISLLELQRLAGDIAL
jgi:outer membrane protein